MPLPSGEYILPGSQPTLSPTPPAPPQTQADLVPQPDPMAGAAENVWSQPQEYIPSPTPEPALREANGLGPCCERTGEGYCCPRDWYFVQGIRVMNHPKPRGVSIGQRGAIVEAYNGITYVDVYRQNTNLNTRCAVFEPSGGYEGTVGHYLGRDSDNRDQYIEFTYYGLHAWQGGAVTVADEDAIAQSTTLWPNSDRLSGSEALLSGNLFSAFNAGVGGFNRADRQEINYASEWNNFELNLRIAPRDRRDRLILEPSGRWRREGQDNCRVSWLGGVRGISLDENFRFYSTGHHLFFNGATVEEYDVSGLYDVRSRNDMIGLQFGAEVTKRYGLATCGMRAKGAVFVNFADHFSHIRTLGANSDPLCTVADFDVEGLPRSRNVAGLAEFGFLASYQLRPNIVAHAAYDLMWISGLVLAPEQIQAQPIAPTAINTGGTLLMQSVTLGLEINW